MGIDAQCNDAPAYSQLGNITIATLLNNLLLLLTQFGQKWLKDVMCPPGQFPTLSEIYFTMCTVHISIYPERNFQPLVKYISQCAKSIYVIIFRTKYPTIGDEIYLTMCTVQALKLQRVDWTVPMDTQVVRIRMKIFFIIMV